MNALTEGGRDEAGLGELFKLRVFWIHNKFLTVRDDIHLAYRPKTISGGHKYELQGR